MECAVGLPERRVSNSHEITPPLSADVFLYLFVFVYGLHAVSPDQMRTDNGGLGALRVYTCQGVLYNVWGEVWLCSMTSRGLQDIPFLSQFPILYSALKKYPPLLILGECMDITHIQSDL